MKTIDELLAFIRANSKPGDWKLNTDNEVRFAIPGQPRYCPVCWVGHKTGKNKWGLSLGAWTVGREMGLDAADVSLVAAAADHESHPVTAELRVRLLEACHITT